MSLQARYLDFPQLEVVRPQVKIRRVIRQQDTFYYTVTKRLFDFCISLLFIIFIISWLLPVLALIIRLESKGSPIFRQRRTGKSGKTFTCYKLRTMKPNAVADIKQATDNDERITSFGRFLRLSSLDELPQFFNVLSGQMSLVGPRPHMVYHTEKYSSLIPDYKLRHLVKPGITGLAQVKGFRGPTVAISDMENRIREDLKYINRQSFRMDLIILFRTIGTVGKFLVK